MAISPWKYPLEALKASTVTTKKPKSKAPRKRRAPRAIREKKKFDFLALPRELRDDIYERYAGSLRSQVTVGEIEKAKKPYVGARFFQPRALEKRKLHVFLYLSRQTREEYLQTIPKIVKLKVHVNSENKGHFNIPAPLLQNVRTVEIEFNIQSAFVDFLRSSSRNLPDEMIADLDRLFMSLAKVETLRICFDGRRHVMRLSKNLISHFEMLGRAAQRRQESLAKLEISEIAKNLERIYTKVDAETIHVRSTLWSNKSTVLEEYDTK